MSLAKPMISLLSREYHGRQAGWRVNVVQALLEGISLSQPQPKIPSELIKYLGKTFSAWHIAIPLLESHVMLFPNEPRCFDALGAHKALGGGAGGDAAFGRRPPRIPAHLRAMGGSPRRFEILSRDSLCFVPPSAAELYRMLGEEDNLCGLWRQRCAAEQTRSGLALLQARAPRLRSRLRFRFRSRFQ